MAMRCSLLGHDYGDPDVEREREERGSEVVVTVRKYETCARCGDENVLSENTEVTSLSTGSNDASRPDDPDPEPTPETAGTDAAFIDADGDADAAPSERPGDDPDESSDDVETDTDGVTLPTDENGEPITDDGEILDSETSETTRDRERGEWPESEDVGPPIGSDSEPADWPAEPDAEDDAVLLESETSETAVDAEPVADTGDTDGAESAGEPGTGIERAEEAPAPGDESVATTDDVPTEFYCPNCDYVADGDRASLRPGDICPDCRKGYLGERQRR